MATNLGRLAPASRSIALRATYILRAGVRRTVIASSWTCSGGDCGTQWFYGLKR